jgi:hypothetical protein
MTDNLSERTWSTIHPNTRPTGSITINNHTQVNSNSNYINSPVSGLDHIEQAYDGFSYLLPKYDFAVSSYAPTFGSNFGLGD